MTRRGERGQATVEFALIIPVVIFLAMLLVQVALVASAKVAVTHAAREVARALAVNPAADVGRLTLDVTGLDTNYAKVSVVFEETEWAEIETVFVTISYEIAPITPVFGGFSGLLTVEGKAKMIVET